MITIQQFEIQAALKNQLQEAYSEISKKNQIIKMQSGEIESVREINESLKKAIRLNSTEISELKSQIQLKMHLLQDSEARFKFQSEMIEASKETIDFMNGIIKRQQKEISTLILLLNHVESEKQEILNEISTSGTGAIDIDLY